MNENQNPEYNVPQQPQYQPPRQTQQFQSQPKNKWIKPTLIGLGVIFAFGLGIGAGGETESTETAASEEAEPEVKTETKTVTKEIEKTPQACLDALDYSDELTGYMSEALGSASDAMGYATSFDWDSLDAETAKLEELTPKVREARDNYDTAAIECRVN